MIPVYRMDPGCRDAQESGASSEEEGHSFRRAARQSKRTTRLQCIQGLDPLCASEAWCES